MTEEELILERISKSIIFLKKELQILEAGPRLLNGWEKQLKVLALQYSETIQLLQALRRNFVRKIDSH